MISINLIFLTSHWLFGVTQFIEECPPPWLPYMMKGSQSATLGEEACNKNKCVGSAFHNHKGELICFGNKFSAQSKYTLSSNVSKSGDCDCGYTLKHYRRTKEWISIEHPKIETRELSRTRCMQVCRQITIYYFTRGREKKILHIEKEKRELFYEIAGHFQIQMIKRNESFVKVKKCWCGIKSMDLIKFKNKKFEESVFDETKLLDTCLSPWLPYYIRGSLSGVLDQKFCSEKCIGKAFYGGNNTLVCFHIKRNARFKIDRINDKLICECGYTMRPFQGEKFWTSFHPQIPNVLASTKKNCKKRCLGVTFYLYSRRNQKSIIYVEDNERNSFYNIEGTIGTLQEGNWSDQGEARKFRWCTCGIKSLDMKELDSTRVKAPQVGNILENFQTCSSPWREYHIFTSRNEACVAECQLICGRAKGVYRQNAALCFHKSVQAEPEKIIQGSTESKCRCGHTEKVVGSFANSNDPIPDSRRGMGHRFIDCNPPMEAENKTTEECASYCKKVFILIYKRPRSPKTITCLINTNSDFEKAEPLVANCDPKVHTITHPTRKSRYYMVCHCGLNIDKMKIYKKEENVKNLSKAVTWSTPRNMMSLPPIWGVKKARSKNKTHKYTTRKITL